MLKHTLRRLGLEEERLRLIWASAAEGPQLARAFRETVEAVRPLGPLGWPGNWSEEAAEVAAGERISHEQAETVEVHP
jgi:F420-non-reducing hydrogenase iron-sulfur subunit